jgi:hypothetical protein
LGKHPDKQDCPECREDLVRKAAESTFKWNFDWLDDRVANRVQGDDRNRGLTAVDIRELARDWIQDGNTISCKPEGREPYRDRRHFYYYVIVKDLDGFELQKGLFVEMELGNCDEDEPLVNLLNAHPPSF